MITFHPTISLHQFIRRLLGASADPLPSLQALFPDHIITLTDSGRSALGVIIESLNLSGTRMALPAFLCDSLLPVITHYNITPVFIDIDPDTYQPSLRAYEKEPFDVALLVATYGRKPDEKLIQLLKERGSIVIEDYAHVSLPLTSETTSADTRYYSVSKILPVPDGGIAVLQKDTSHKNISAVPSFSLATLKDILKLIPFIATLVTKLRLARHASPRAPEWNGIAAMRSFSRRFLGHALADTERYASSYCLPLSVSDPDEAQRILLRHGIVAERIWDHPIIEQKENIDSDTFPITRNAAARTLCVPMWHLRKEEERKDFEKKVKKYCS